MELLDFTIKIAEKAGKLILKKSKKGFSINHKASHKDIVTEVDHATEEFLIKEIHKQFPDHMILAEETANQKPKTIPDYIWIIDPIDGTTNFARGLDQFTVSIGLFKTEQTKRTKNFDYLAGEIILGVVHAPKLGETFYAEKGQGAYLNGKKLQVTKTKKVSHSMLATGFPANQKEPNIHYFSHMLDQSMAIRRFGAASLDICYVAKGIYDGYWEFGLSPWDIAAGALIAEEAGATATDTNGEQLDLFGRDIMVTNGHIHSEMVKIFSHMRS